ncbi:MULTISPECIES: DUF4261 domain-containing protein [Clostridium]|uniref:DUF4261 domain-containing protein n=1 Tax=Clostridium faecium TaxID=2762223 RepID=A0ABR8YTC4_9CLOT|nr:MULTISPECIES: DUF4261 domain-containing protein [Clostridium]MBD8047449.1 DUF4261 domain-containing protein [Clostridium faecium]MDU1350565.1 DUF4261 domain-containing protein [Clostridium argentinense]
MFKIFNKKQEKKDKEEEKKNSFALYLLFKDSFVIDKEKLASKIEEIDNDKVSVEPILGLDGDEAFYSYVTIGDDKFRLVGIDCPLPKEISSYTINCGYGNREELEAMGNHKYHVIAFYEGTSADKNHIFNLYSKLAYGFLHYGFLGLANGYSWNVIIPSLIKDIPENKEVKTLLSTPSMMIWRNFIKIPHNEGVWFTTKGNNIYGIPEFAFYGTFENNQEVYNIFEDIFYYIYDTKAEVHIGDTMQIEEEVYLKFREVYELQDTLEGEEINTLVIEKITSSEIN